MSKITRCKIRMYRAGTGDCFVLKFFSGRNKMFTMMIDGGVWQGSGSYIQHFVDNLDEYVDGKLDLLVITHEHNDHVLFFQRCAESFKNFEIDELWLGWTENDGDPLVEEWKEDYGEKKKALSIAAQKIDQLIGDNSITKSLNGERDWQKMLEARTSFSEVLNGFAELHAATDNKVYKGPLEGMRIVKEELNVKKIRYCSQGEIIEGLNNLEGIKFYVLGPPNIYDQVETEEGQGEESYDHNNDLEENDLFAMSMLREPGSELNESILPFERHYLSSKKLDKSSRPYDVDYTADPNLAYEFRYDDEKDNWRKIDYDWLFSAGNLALRMNSLTNNLSLALAIEFEDSKKVMLFPGDAEFGSWQSWHNIDWNTSGPEGKHFTSDLLKRTVFYKVAHHLSHNGTARSLGLDMMTHSELAAMATLDYGNISSGWKSTMPNRGIVKDLLKKTKGRLMILNDEDLHYDFDGNIPLKDKIEEVQDLMSSKEKKQFEKDFDIPNPKSIKYKRSNKTVEEEKILYYEYTVDGKP